MSLGVSMPQTNAEFRTLVEATAAMGPAGADTLAILLEISGAFAEMTQSANELGESVDGAWVFRNVSSFFVPIRSNDINGLFNGVNDSNLTEMLNPLVDAFGDDNAVISAVISMVNNFRSAGTQWRLREQL